MQFHLCNKQIQFLFQKTADSQEHLGSQKYLITGWVSRDSISIFSSRKGKQQQQQQQPPPPTQTKNQTTETQADLFTQATNQLPDSPPSWPDSGHDPQHASRHSVHRRLGGTQSGDHLSSLPPTPRSQPKAGSNEGRRAVGRARPQGCGAESWGCHLSAA